MTTSWITEAIRALKPVCEKVCTEAFYDQYLRGYYPELFINPIKELTTWETICEVVSNIDPRLAAGVTSLAVAVGGSVYYLRNRNGTVVVEPAKKDAKETPTVTVVQTSHVAHDQAHAPKSVDADKEAERQAQEALLKQQQAEEAARQAQEALLKQQQAEQVARELALATQKQEEAARQEALKKQQQEAARQAQLKKQQEEAAARQAQLKKQQEEAARQEALLKQQQAEAASQEAAKREELAKRLAAESQKRANAENNADFATNNRLVHTQAALMQEALLRRKVPNVLELAEPQGAVAVPQGPRQVPVQGIMVAYYKSKNDKATMFQYQGGRLDKKAEEKRVFTELGLDENGYAPTTAEGIKKFNDAMESIKHTYRM